jgi:histidyl-tRNA synthetase
MMRSANRMQATYALLIGEEERANKTVSVKNLTTSEQQSVAQADLISFFAHAK